MALLIESAICLGVDQIKAVPLQTIIYYVVVRRCGLFEITPDFEGKWEDDKIFIGGQEMSLFAKIRNKVEKFIETPLISNIILGMTIFLCIVIFTELAIAEPIEDSIFLTNLFRITNFALLTFFLIEIALKSFAYGFDFYWEFINTFDSIVVIISFVMLILDLKLKILGLLRVLRLIKVIVTMKKVSDEKRERQEAIKK